MTKPNEIEIPDQEIQEIEVAVTVPSEAMEASQEELTRTRKALAVAEKALDLISKTEQRRFLMGSVLLPLLITMITIGFGSRIASNYQDWQDRRSRIRDVIDGIREATTKLSANLEALAQQGSSVERIRAKQAVLEEVRAVDEALLNLKGRADTLAQAPHEPALNVQAQATLKSSIESCKENVDLYVDCLSNALSAPPNDQQPCTTDFREKIAAKGSCKSLETIAYSIGY